MAKHKRIRWDDDDDRRVARDGEAVHCPIHLMDGRQREVAAFAIDMANMALHQPGFRTADGVTSYSSSEARDAARSARDAWIADMSSAWRTDARRKKNGNGDPDEPDEDDLDREQDRRSRSAADAQQARDAAYRQMVDRLGGAWRTPARDARDAREPDAAEQLLPHNDPAGAMRRHMSGATDPGAAAAVFAEAERMKGATAEQAAALERDRDRLHEEFKRNLENAWRRA
jgi:hypothetical protein